ncbi:histone deacetylase complex subunit SAP130-A isoform X1 [Anastrepha obliqua]|uniref:histone deacetylase complex subunit SAP130-A isoform X1 n=1 Tax=Anastrepha obliqua TaxID=95512 RepID=UPI002409CA3F|nr:histone deacetylase complex subunit SAP130-A isoform X1 [Anastrepha obliqua]XP_054732379.1 histone deacetylase complex subunit SAP130-A isoform X1 [Anastrepha obliqua]XP_054732380.1 histone deacetylase complex subunit SAP130-A isoform X1 [Anastrepha obliqua]
MSTVDTSGGSGGGVASGPGGNSVGGGGGVGSGGGPGGGGSSNTGALSSSMASMGSTQPPTGEKHKAIITHLIQPNIQRQNQQQHQSSEQPTLFDTQSPTTTTLTTSTIATSNHQRPRTNLPNLPKPHIITSVLNPIPNPPTHPPVHTTHLPTTVFHNYAQNQGHLYKRSHHLHASVHFNKLSNIHPCYFNPVAAKISHVKTTLDGNLVNTSSAGGSNIQIGSGTVSGVSTIMTSSVSTTGAIKMTTAGGAIATSIGGTPIALNVAQSPTAIRTIGAGGQSTQVRVVVPTNIIPIKQFDGAAGVGRTQITAIPAGVSGATSRTVSNTSITVTRPLTQTTYFPRAGVNATQMAAVGAGQRLVTPIRTGPNPGSMSAGATVTGLTTAGGFVRGTAATLNRNTSSPATSVISPATSTTWMQTNTGGQVQLIRAIPQQTQKRIITAQGMTTTSGSYNSSNIGGGMGAAVSGTVVAATPPTVVQTGSGGQTQTQPGQGGQSTIQTVSSSVVSHSQAQSQQQQTYVATLATVLPPRQHQATLVYSSNVAATSQPLAQQPQQFNPTVAAGQRLAVATQLSAAAAPVTGTASRQIRPIPLPKSFSAAKLNTTSISIRAPNITSTLQPVGGGGGTIVASSNTASTNSARNTTMSGVATGVGGNVIPTANLPTTRIIQLQQPGGATQPIIGATGRISGNVMYQPIIVNKVSGLRQPVSMTAKPSLTITPFALGKLPAGAGGSATQVGVNLAQQQNVTTSIQSSLGGGGSLSASAGGSGGNSSPALSANTPTSIGGGVTSLSTAQLVNVSQAAAAAAAGQLLTTQNIVSSTTGGGTTVLPLAIATRGNAPGNIITGAITPLKNASAITVGKVMAAANAASLESSTSGMSGASIITSNAGPPTSVYIHQAVSGQRTHGPNVSVSGTNLNAPLSSSSNNTTVLTSSGGVGNIPTSAGAFLPPGGTIYYESVPASSVQVSTGVLSLTTSTVTSSTLPPTQNQLANAAPATNLAISSLPFAASAVSHAGNSTATFTVVPSTGGRSIGQLQIPVSSAAGTQIQSVPLRFSAQLTSAAQSGGNANSSNALSADAISVSQATQQLLQQSGVTGGQQLIIPASAAASAHQVASGATTATQGQHVVIPLQTSIKVTGGSAGSAVVSNFLRKRDVEGSPLRVAKNLAPTLISMSGGSGTILTSAAASPAASSVGSSFSITSVAPLSTSSMTSIQTTTASALTTEALNKKDRAQAAATGSVIGLQRVARGESPGSSDGSTTVSANSSPGVEQQMQDGNMMMINHMPHGTNESTHFNPINEMYSNHHGNVNMHHNVLMSGGSGTPISSRNSSLDHHQQLHAPVVSNVARLNGGPIECSTRKKSRRSTNDSQLSSHSQGSLSLPPPSSTGVAVSHMNNNNNNNYELSAATTNVGIMLAPVHSSMAPDSTGSSIPHQYDDNNTNANAIASSSAHNYTSNHKNNNLPATTGNKENAKPVEFILRRPRNFTLLNAYKQNWKAANNHFQRYTDVKPREERRPTVIDLANQSNVMGKINGWKIYHLSSQMEDLCENESNGYDQLSNMLKQMETHEKNPEIERINELLKGNIQRSKIIVDGINDAQNQMMKIFEHKSHISDILHRCASKRNFKKREKF